MEALTNFQIAAAVAVVYGTWILLRTLFKKNPLDNVPGPRPVPGLKGWLRGNWPALIHPRSWSYHRK
ncbi:hypothetical protein FA13DRAFT_1790362 [Coprinellus micaceus]|uniref:Uncharacterized protein n=1 Tax=Coprinellus micaceus TaxID=71717 RepID=A0A4Y7TFB0_COPMI|nr:hypothetical protein FA13DRAFT_1790362 [Coprinellus micaceus]